MNRTRIGHVPAFVEDARSPCEIPGKSQIRKPDQILMMVPDERSDNINDEPLRGGHERHR